MPKQTKNERKLTDEENFRLFELMREERREQLLAVEESKRKYILAISSAIISLFVYILQGKNLVSDKCLVTFILLTFLITVILSIWSFHLKAQFAVDRMLAENDHYLKNMEIEPWKNEKRLKIVNCAINILFSIGMILIWLACVIILYT